MRCNKDTHRVMAAERILRSNSQCPFSPRTILTGDRDRTDVSVERRGSEFSRRHDEEAPRPVLFEFFSATPAATPSTAQRPRGQSPFWSAAIHRRFVSFAAAKAATQDTVPVRLAL
jgi:hypothetical protein